MKKAIWKFPMGMATTHEMPEGAEFLHLAKQGEEVCAWFLLVPENKKEVRKFRLYGTGHEIPMSERYLGTVHSPLFVWHLFE